MTKELDKEYEKTLNLISQKIEACALLFKEAAQLAKSINSNLTYLHVKGDLIDPEFDEYELNYVLDPLILEMEDLGWATSSLRC